MHEVLEFLDQYVPFSCSLQGLLALSSSGYATVVPALCRCCLRTEEPRRIASYLHQRLLTRLRAPHCEKPTLLGLGELGDGVVISRPSSCKEACPACEA